MSLSLLLVGLFTAQNLPENPTVTYTGIPTLTRGGTAYPGVRVVSHSVTLELRAGRIQVSSTTLFKNETAEPVYPELTIPIRAYQNEGAAPPEVSVRVLWDQTEIGTRALPSQRTDTRRRDLQLVTRDLRTVAPMVAKGSHALRLSMTLPLGSAGPDGKLRLVGYHKTAGATIGQFRLAFRYPEPGSVFNLPTLTPDARGWEVGTQGAFFGRNNYTPDGEVTLLRFYEGGF